MAHCRILELETFVSVYCNNKIFISKIPFMEKYKLCSSCGGTEDCFWTKRSAGRGVVKVQNVNTREHTRFC